jgi:SLT domain-containing protein
MTARGPVPLRAYESGGTAREPQLALYGEGRRPEAYVPLPDGRTIPVTLEGGAGGETHNYHITMNVSGQVDADRLMSDLVDAARRAKARGRTHLSYGS